MNFNIKKLLGMEKKEKRRRPILEFSMLNVTIATTSLALILLSVNFTYFADNAQMFTLINLIVAIVALGVPLLYRYTKYGKFKRVEAAFPHFLRDITESVKSGMTITQAIRTASRNDYGEFTPYAKEMAAKISWGVPLSTVLEDFAGKIGSPGLKRTVQTINEAHKSGGTIQTVLSAVAETTQEIEKIKKERSASVYAQMINGYLIFFIFLGVMVGISSFLVPAFQFGDSSQSELNQLLPELFRNLVVIQGIFAGIAVGKMAEGTFLAGAKHSLVLTVIGYSVFIFFG